MDTGSFTYLGPSPGNQPHAARRCSVAKIIISPEETPDYYWKRFNAKVAKERILSDHRAHNSFVSKSQRRRKKSAAARKRFRKTEQTKRRFTKPSSFKDYSGYDNDLRTGWPISLNSQPKPNNTQIDNNQGNSAYAACIIPYVSDGISGLIVVKNMVKYDDDIMSSDKFGFPGGSVKFERGELPIDGAVRETEEETGFIVDPNPNPIYVTHIGNHTQYFYGINNILSDHIVLGEDIETIAVMSIADIFNQIELGQFRSSHGHALNHYLDLLKGVA